MRPIQHRLHAEQTHPADSPETAYAKRKTAQWILTLSAGHLALESELFVCIQWSCGNLRPMIEQAAGQAAKNRSKTGKTAHQAIMNILDGPSRNYAYEIEDLIDEYPFLRPLFAEQIQRLCREATASADTDPAEPYITARRELERVFGLDEDCKTVCEFIFLVQNFSEIESYFEGVLDIFRFGNLRLLSRILDMSQARLSGCIKELHRFGILKNIYDSAFRLIDPILAFWSSDPPDSDQMFSRPLSGEWLPLTSFHLPDEEIRHVCRLLKQHGSTPVNILLYGPSGTGKSTFVRSLARACGVKAWSVISRDADDDCDRRASLSACLHVASGHERAFVVVDEAERLLDTDFAFGHQTKDKAWLNDFLERPGQRIVWISNQIGHIDPAVRRRFSYSIHFTALGVQERVEVWRQVMKRQGLSRRFHEPYMTELSIKYPVQAAVIQKAVSQSCSLYADRDGFHASLDRILKAHLALQNEGEFRPKTIRSSSPEFRLDGVCTDEDVSALMERCRRVDSTMRSGQTLQPGWGTMLFYGPPGTGKTALARFIADTLHREALIKRASDLLSPFVGVTEQQVTSSFHEAEECGAVLVIDEVDTFLYSRDEARHSWEVSLVNEFLTSLEECRGFCICTTNRQEQLDAAVMRRFSHKVRFRYANSLQVQKLYDTFLAPLCKEVLPDTLRQRLAGMTCLTPGDFHTVQCRYHPLLTVSENLSHDLLVQALFQETALKPNRQNRRIGFIR